MNKQDKTDLLWKTIGRYDAFYSNVNNKGALILAFDAFVLGSLVLKFSDILNIYKELGPVKWLAALAITIIFLSTLLSIFYTFLAINPFLKSSKYPNPYRSILFFNHVAEHETEAAYMEEVEKLETEKFMADLVYQTHSLATGLKGKFSKIKVAIRWNLVQIICLLVLGFFKIFLAFI